MPLPIKTGGGADVNLKSTTDGVNGEVIHHNIDTLPPISVTGNVTVVQATHDNLNLNANLQVGNVDAATANPVPVQIGDGTLTATVRNTGTADSLNVAIVDGSGNQITSFGGSGGTSHADDAAFTPGSASSITPVGYLADETTPDAVDEGDVGVARMTLTRKAYAVLADPVAERAATVRDTGTNDALNVAIVDASGNQITTFGGSGGTAMADDAPFTVGSASSITPAAGVYQSTVDLVDAGDAGALRMTQRRALIVSHETPLGDSMVDDTLNALNVVLAGQLSAADHSVAIGAPLPAGTNTLGGIRQVNTVGLQSSNNSGGNVSASSNFTGTLETALDYAGIGIEGKYDQNGTFEYQISADSGTTWTTVLSRATTANARFGFYIPFNGALAYRVRWLNGTASTALGYLTTIRLPFGQALPQSLTAAGNLRVSVEEGSAAGTEFNIGTAAGATDAGSVPLAIRDDALSTLSDPEGDYVPLRVSSTGALHVTGGGGGTEYTVDAVAPATPTGGAFLMERDDALSALTEIEGDWTNARANANGALWVAHDGAVVLGAGTAGIGKLTANSGVDIGDVDVTTVIPGTGATQLGKAVDSAAGATDTGVALLAVRDDTLAALTPVDGDYTHLRVNSQGALHVTGAGGGTQYAVDTAAGGTDSGTLLLAVRDDALTTLTPVDGDYSQLRVDSVGALHVKQAALAAANDSVAAAGMAAHDSSVSGNPLLMGAEARTTLGTAVTQGDAVRLAANRYGMPLVSSIVPSRASSNGTPITATTTSVIAAPSAGNHLRITRFYLSNGGATATWVGLRDGAAGTQYYRTYLPQGATVSPDLNLSGPLDLTTATRLDLVLSAAGSLEYTLDYLTVAD